MPAHYIQANTNGRIHPASEPSVSPLNRGFLYGDAIYEVWRTYHGVLFAWEEHWTRLRASAAALHMSLEITPGQILAEIRRSVAAYRLAAPNPAELIFVFRSPAERERSASTPRWRTGPTL